MAEQSTKRDFGLREIPRRLVDRVAVVTGSGHGIGKAYARRLAQEGASVVIAELDGAAAEASAAALAAEGLRALAVRTDIADAGSLANMVGRTVKEFGALDILVNNAAIFTTVKMSRLTFDQIDPLEWERMMKVNLTGTWLACRAAVPIMRQHGYGKIVNISSATALRGRPTGIHYVTSKAGILGFTKVLAWELAKDGITVNALAPGSTLSEAEADADPGMVELTKRASLARAIPRVQTSLDLVGAVAFLASPDSDFMTGETLVVDGGSVMH